VTTGSTVSTATENAAISESSPVVALNESAIVLKAGAVKLSQQLLDRAGPGISGDVFVFTQIKNQLMAQIDVYALSQALTGASTVANNGSFEVAKASGVGGFVADVKKAKAKIADQVGIRLKATHIHAIPDLVDYIGAWADAQGRPVFSPTFDNNSLPVRSGNDPAGEGFSGYVIEGCALYENANIPNQGTTANTQVVVTRCETILLFTSDAVPYLYPQTLSNTLQAEIGVRQYVAAVAKHGARPSRCSRVRPTPRARSRDRTLTHLPPRTGRQSARGNQSRATSDLWPPDPLSRRPRVGTILPRRRQAVGRAALILGGSPLRPTQRES
jgi:hypothetical protein